MAAAKKKPHVSQHKLNVTEAIFRKWYVTAFVDTLRKINAGEPCDKTLVSTRRIILHAQCPLCSRTICSIPREAQYIDLWLKHGMTMFRFNSIKDVTKRLLERAGVYFCHIEVNDIVCDDCEQASRAKRCGECGGNATCDECAKNSPKTVCLLCQETHFKKDMIWVGEVRARPLVKQQEHLEWIEATKRDIVRIRRDIKTMNMVCENCVVHCTKCRGNLAIRSGDKLCYLCIRYRS